MFRYWCCNCRQFVRRQCARCRQPILYNELVVQTNELVYHSDCFACALCHHRFTPGQHFAVAQDGNVYCPTDFQLKHQSEGGVPTHDAMSTHRDVSAPDSTAHVPLCRSTPPLPSGVDSVAGAVWSEVPRRQLQTVVRSSDTLVPNVAGQEADDATTVSLHLYFALAKVT